MENLGQYLRSKREERNLTVEAVHADIKICIEHINAMEDNQLAKLGNYGFARTMVYTYARFLGAEEKIAINLFDIMWPSQKQADFTPKKPIKEKKMLISINFIWLISIVIFVIILGSIIWVSYNKGYLKRPFDKLKETPDTVKVSVRTEKVAEKPDTLRQRLLDLTKNQPAQLQTPVKQSVKVTTKNKKVVSDTTDYVNEFIFQAGESPFNPRF